MKKLFDQMELNNRKIKNRFVRSGLWIAGADSEGHLTPELIDVYVELAKGGVGILTTGYARIVEEEAPNPNMLAMYDDKFIEEYKQLTDLVHEHDTVFLMQLAYGGSMTGYNLGTRTIFGPSAIENEATRVTPVAMTVEDIAYITKSFADAALRAKKAGFDGITIHSAHGYLLSQFLCPYYNQRTDQYGGSIENRSRIHMEVYDAIRTACGEDFIITIKINVEDFMEADGLTAEESMFVCEKLSKRGIDAIELSGGNSSSKYVLANNLATSRTKIKVSRELESYFKDYAIELSKRIETPIILVGGNRSQAVMNEILQNSNVEYFAFGRPLTADPDLINKMQADENFETKCISCNKCFKTNLRRCIFNVSDEERAAIQEKDRQRREQRKANSK